MTATGAIRMPIMKGLSLLLRNGHGLFPSGTIAWREFGDLNLKAAQVHGKIHSRCRVLIDVKGILCIQIQLQDVFLYLLGLHVSLDGFNKLRDAFGVEL